MSIQKPEGPSVVAKGLMNRTEVMVMSEFLRDEYGGLASMMNEKLKRRPKINYPFDTLPEVRFRRRGERR